MNILTDELRLQIGTALLEGKTIREVAKEFGVHRETVCSCTFYAYRRQLSYWTSKLYDYFEKHKIEPIEVKPFMELNLLVDYKCPLHPKWDALEDDYIEVHGSNCSPCRACKAAGMKRHHQRRKAEGRPIIPPRKIASLVSSKNARNR